MWLDCKNSKTLFLWVKSKADRADSSYQSFRMGVKVGSLFSWGFLFSLQNKRYIFSNRWWKSLNSKKQNKIKSLWLLENAKFETMCLFPYEHPEIYTEILDLDFSYMFISGICKHLILPLFLDVGNTNLHLMSFNTLHPG